MYDVFICHCSTDKDSVVDPLVEACTNAGIVCWVDSREIQWGDSIPQRISEGLQQSRFVLVVISQHTITRRWQPSEISAALNAENSHGSIRVLPLYVGDREELEQRMPLLAGKHALTWQSNPVEIALKLKQRIVGKSRNDLTPSDVANIGIDYVPKLARKITDRDRDKFLEKAFSEICQYFESAGRVFEQAEPSVSVKIQKPDAEKFRCLVYVDGNRKCQCQVWMDASFGKGGINYFSGNSIGHEFNARNETISVEESSGELALRGMMGGHFGSSIESASPRKAAESLWQRLVRQLEQ